MGQPNSQGTRIRWPELEIGANSVTPWVMPSTMACKTDRTAPSRCGARPCYTADRGNRPEPSALRGGDGDRELGEGLREGQALGLVRAHQQHERRTGGGARWLERGPLRTPEHQ